MSPRRFCGRDMSEALQAVRSSLGPDALILETRSVKLENGAGVEITAMGEDVEATRPSRNETVKEEKLSAEPIEEVRQEIAALKSMLSWLAPELTHKNKILQTLLAQGLAPEIIARLAEAMTQSDGSDDREKIYYALSRLLPSGGQIRGDRAADRLALVGPTGVGKTTSLVKLTVFELQRRNCRVGWISTENRRVAGNDPLAVYAGILGVHYETVDNKKELKQSLARLSDCDVVLVDTPGVSPRDQKGIDNLANLLRGVPELRRTLLISAATDSREMTDWVNIYRKMGLESLFFTKLDECRYFGALINVAMGFGHPLSYLALGQNMAGDLAVANPQVLTSLLLTGVDQHDRNQLTSKPNI